MLNWSSLGPLRLGQIVFLLVAAMITMISIYRKGGNNISGSIIIGGIFPAIIAPVFAFSLMIIVPIAHGYEAWEKVSLRDIFISAGAVTGLGMIVYVLPLLPLSFAVAGLTGLVAKFVFFFARKK